MTIRNVVLLIFTVEDISTFQIPKLEDHPLSAVQDSLLDNLQLKTISGGRLVDLDAEMLLHGCARTV